jgi:photosystem II stability/assembly factor-like uncharacterized protein
LATPPDIYAFWSGDPFLYLFDGSDNTLSRSADSGKTWALLQKGGYFDQLYPKGDSLWASVRDSGLMLSSDGGKHFRDIPMRAGSFPLMEATGDRILLPGFGVYDNQGGNWRHAAPEPTFPTPDHLTAEGDLAFAHCYYSGPYFVSRDGGLSWDSLPPILPGTRDTSRFLTAAIHRGRLFLARSDGVYRSDDTGASWIRTRAYHGPAFGFTGYVSFLSAGSDFFLTDTGGVFRTTDEGDHWLPAGKGISGEIRILAGTEQALYAAGYDRLFRSTDRGANWNLANANRPELKHLLAYGNSYLATYDDTGGVEISLDGGARWARSNQGLSVSTATVAMAIAGSQAYLSIYGGSIWKRPLSEFFPVGLNPAPPPDPQAYEGLRLIRGPAGPAVAFTLHRSGPVRLEAFDPQGRSLAVLAAGRMAPGPHIVPLGRWMRPSPIRYLRLSAEGTLRSLTLPPGF